MLHVTETRHTWLDWRAEQVAVFVRGSICQVVLFAGDLALG